MRRAATSERQCKPHHIPEQTEHLLTANFFNLLFGIPPAQSLHPGGRGWPGGLKTPTSEAMQAKPPSSRVVSDSLWD